MNKSYLKTNYQINDPIYDDMEQKYKKILEHHRSLGVWPTDSSIPKYDGANGQTFKQYLIKKSCI